MGKLDDRLKPYATQRQWDNYSAWIEAGKSWRAAAKVVGSDAANLKRSIRAMLKRAAQGGWAPDYDLTKEAAPGFVVKGTSTLYDEDGSIKEQWNKTRLEGLKPSEAIPPLPLVQSVSTNYDEQGKVRSQWVKTKADADAIMLAWRSAAEALASDLPRVDPIPAPTNLRSDLMTCYPVGDHHLGMLSWPEETGGDWDIKLAGAALQNAFDHLISTAPPSDQAAIVFLGDFMHYDSFETVTPTSRHLLDADGRFPKMVRASISAMRYAIERTASRHGRVKVIVEIGNHDLSSSIFLMECLKSIYGDNPRVEIDNSPRHYHYFEFGRTLIGTHHGHGSKMDRLPSIMAADQPEAWGRTKYRYWWTGHIHHQTVKDFEACSVESFRILAPSDAWAHQKGYRAMRDMKSIILHREFGEVARHTVTPEMFKG